MKALEERFRLGLKESAYLLGIKTKKIKEKTKETKYGHVIKKAKEELLDMVGGCECKEQEHGTDTK